MEALVFKVILIIIIANSGKNRVKKTTLKTFFHLLVTVDIMGIYFRILHCTSNA